MSFFPVGPPPGVPFLGPSRIVRIDPSGSKTAIGKSAPPEHLNWFSGPWWTTLPPPYPFAATAALMEFRSLICVGVMNPLSWSGSRESASSGVRVPIARRQSA
jgi:hypothetical protein